MDKFNEKERFVQCMKDSYPPGTRTVILCCFQINRVNCYEQTVQSLKEKQNKE